MQKQSLKSIGNQGEYEAMLYLQKKGLRLIEKNYCKQAGQIDLVMYDLENEEIVFVEVKTRKAGYQEDLVVSDKQVKTILRTVEYWLSKNHKEEAQARVDLVVVESDGQKFKFRWYKNAIY